MELAIRTRRFAPRLKPLAACLAAALAMSAGMAAEAKATSTQQQLQAQHLASLPANAPPWQRRTPVMTAMQQHHPLPHDIPALPASTIAVTNCDDSGPGSLRDALQVVALDGDTVDMTGLSCSVITLTTGSILFFQNSITLQGPGASSLYLSGGGATPNVAPLLHDGFGTLTVNDMTIEDGGKYFTDAQITDARGGCIFSAGFVEINDAEVKYCTAQNSGSSYGAVGGAIYAAYGVGLSNASIHSSSVSSTSSGLHGDGGGIYTPGSVTILDSFVESNTASRGSGGVEAHNGGLVKYSQISNNEAYSTGGIYLKGNATIENSTISNNAAGLGGGVWLNGTGATGAVTVLSSTVSGNNAANSDVGGIFLYGGNYTARVANSTIAFNTTHFTGSLKYGAGLRSILSTIELESNIIAGNTNDSGGGAVLDDVDGSASVSLTGANNLIGISGLTTPPDTISSDPQLLPLANNGGETDTHAIRVTSPAINAGNNAAAVANDQRGVGFPRSIQGHRYRRLRVQSRRRDFPRRIRRLIERRKPCPAARYPVGGAFLLANPLTPVSGIDPTARGRPLALGSYA